MTVSPDPHLDTAIGTHDAMLAHAQLDIWIGAEPTFTLRRSEAPEWLSEALGGDKHDYALRLLGALRQQHPGCLVLRSVGRQYPGERRPRWSLGLLERRSGEPLWKGPPDPLTGPAPAVAVGQLDSFGTALEHSCRARGWRCMRLDVAAEFARRLLVRFDGDAIVPLDEWAKDLARPLLHTHKTPAEGLRDPLAANGMALLAIGTRELAPDAHCICIELPVFEQVDDFLACIEAIEQAAGAAGLAGLVLQGHPPPIDADLAWTTVTPDPAVIEINQAPQPDVTRFLSALRELFALAAPLGLSPYRLQYNGTASDSGGGGQFTLGGRRIDTSPFLLHPTLLPRLVRYVNHHPALSYLFAPDYVGAASQSPRADEGTREHFRELAVALQQLQRQTQPSAEFLWASLAPFLADPSGNAHRSELNIEKLWNPYLPERGCLGLVEFRAFRMPYSAERAAAIAALLRALTAMLVTGDPCPVLCDWGDTLHERFALPFFLAQDLHQVCDDLAASGFGLDPSLHALLLNDPLQARWQADITGGELTIERAVEFWPLVGDVASQETGGSRLVDSSTLRLQLCLRQLDPAGPALDGWCLLIAGYEVPLRHAQDARGEVRLIGLRYRDFTPWRGLHPGIEPRHTLPLTLVHPAIDQAWQFTLHGWQPDGQAYPGLPEDLDTAAVRRRERLVITSRPRAAVAAAAPPPAEAISDYTFDLRRVW